MLLRMGFPLLVAMLFLAACGGSGGGSDGGGEEDATFSITTSSLGSAIEGAPYNAAIATSHGSENGYQWSISAGSLPPGLSLTGGTPNATLTGTPTSAGTYDFTVQADDPAGDTATRALSLTVSPAPALAVTTTTLTDPQEGVAYHRAVSAAGGTGTGYDWSVSQGSLPPGLALSTSASSGTISGTPTAHGIYDFTLQVEDSAANTATQAYTVTVMPATPLSITTTSLPDADQNFQYSELITASDGSGQGYQWAVVSGSLPPGLGLTDGTPSATLDGAPPTLGGYAFTVEVTDSYQSTATQQFTVNVLHKPLAITTNSLPDGTTGAPYSEAIQAEGGTPPYTWSITTGNEPLGLTLGQGTPDAQLSGTPEYAGSYSITVTVEDGASSSSSMIYTFDILAGPLSITTQTLPYAVETKDYRVGLMSTGGTGWHTWSVTSGALPPGIVLKDSSYVAVLAGTPSQSGSFSFTLQVEDSATTTAPQSYTLQVHSPTGPLLITTNPPSLWSTRRSSMMSLEATGGSGSGYVFSLATGSAVPPGMTFSASGSPSVSGQPTQAGSYTFTIEVTDSAQNTAQRTYTAVVDDYVRCFGIPLRKKVVFLLDASGSMGGTRVDSMRAEVVSAIDQMDSSYELDCVAFGSQFPAVEDYSVFMWAQLLTANSGNKSAAIDWVNGPTTNPGGGTPTYPCVKAAADWYPPELGSMILITDSAPNTAGSALQLLADAPTWWTKFQDCRMECVALSPYASVLEYIHALSSVLGGGYVAA